MDEIIGAFSDAPTGKQITERSGKKYIVVSHYTGKKDIDKVLIELARKRALRDLAS